MGTIWVQDRGGSWTSAIVDGAIAVRRAMTVGLGALLTAYLRRQSRHQLGSLDDRALADVGLTRLDVTRELDKPFWR